MKKSTYKKEKILKEQILSLAQKAMDEKELNLSHTSIACVLLECANFLLRVNNLDDEGEE